MWRFCLLRYSWIFHCRWRSRPAIHISPHQSYPFYKTRKRWFNVIFIQKSKSQTLSIISFFSFQDQHLWSSSGKCTVYIVRCNTAKWRHWQRLATASSAVSNTPCFGYIFLKTASDSELSKPPIKNLRWIMSVVSISVIAEHIYLRVSNHCCQLHVFKAVVVKVFCRQRACYNLVLWRLCNT